MSQVEKCMQFGNFDNFHSHQPKENSRYSNDDARSITRWRGKLFRSPLAIVLLVWGFLFLVLGVALACAQEAGHDVNQRRTAAGPERAGCGKKTEVVDLFSAGEDPVIPSQAPAVKASSRRHKSAVRRRARR
jgi:hypothetical protein